MAIGLSGCAELDAKVRDAVSMLAADDRLAAGRENFNGLVALLNNRDRDYTRLMLTDRELGLVVFALQFTAQNI